MKCAILGAGAIGTLIAGQMSEVDGVELLLCSREEQAMALSVLGLQLEIDGDTKQIPPSGWVVIADELNHLHGDDFPEGWIRNTDVVMICSKSSSTTELSEIAAMLLSSNGFVISLQNGITNENILAEKCGSHRTLGALTTHGATRLGPGITKWAGKGEIVIGNLGVKSDQESDQVSHLLHVLENADLEPRWSDSIKSELWMKLLLNCAVNPLAAICGVSNGTLLESSDLHAQSIGVMIEAAQIGRSIGIQLPDDEALIERLDSVLVATSDNDCSMLQDVRRGRITEIDSINGEILKVAEQVGIPCPLNAQLVALIKGIESTLYLGA